MHDAVTTLGGGTHYSGSMLQRPGSRKDSTFVSRHRPSETTQIRFIALIWLAIFVLLLAQQSFGGVIPKLKSDVPNKETYLLLAASFFLAFVAAMPSALTDLAKRLTGLEIAGFKLTLAERQALAAAKPIREFNEERDGVKVAQRKHSGNVQSETAAVAEVATNKLNFIRDAILDMPESLGQFDVIAALVSQQLLNEDEAAALRNLLGAGDIDISKLKLETVGPLLDDLWEFSSRLAATVFDRHARAEFRAAGWVVGDFKQGAGHRPDVIIARGSNVVVAANRVGAGVTSTVAPSAKRIAKYRAGSPAGSEGSSSKSAVSIPVEPTTRWIVVPNRIDDAVFSALEKSAEDTAAEVLHLRDAVTR